ncbi:indolepyruvate oxidoreductase subunit beta family protein [Limnohabitans sp. 2KL-27]|uniref:indolepyruvate oxidoreductase subunit beta family protein n=1 Tax=Limnohabitans sp. 2KL-27 TaxID=1100705 RepID=UPI000ADA40F3|nr:indolepyruvate oxidoreductase subunit beta family protein [Limnohabitans sp. 2KL-27]
MTQAISILLCALGGEGGGVLADWLVDVARHAGHPAQATSIPGVAQRTGATTYYLEVYPLPHSQLQGRWPVLGLNPLPGRLDALVSSELLETARQIGNGLASADRTLVISASSRALTTAEKMTMGDGRRAEGPLLDVVAAHSLRHHVLDMAQLCQQSGTMVSAVMLGSVAGSGLLPFARTHYEAVLAGPGASAQASLRGFALAFDRVARQREQAQYVEHVLKPEPPAPAASAGLPADVAARFPAALHPLMGLAHQRLLEYQGPAYAQLYVQRLARLLNVENFAADASHPVTAETSRWLALWMAFDDIVRVADLKSRASRWARVTQEVKAQEGDVLKVYDHFKPGVPELAALLPQGLAKRLLRWDRARVVRGQAPWSMPLKVARHALWGMASLRLLASLRVLRPLGSRYATEQALIEEWLDGIENATRHSPALGLELARCGQLIKGYGSTNERGKDNLLHILRQVCGTASKVPVAEQAQAVARIRQAALLDEAGQALDQALLQHGAPARPVKEQPVLWMKNPRLKKT